MLTRRSLVAGMGALGASRIFAAPAGAALPKPGSSPEMPPAALGSERMRLAVISDIHISDKMQQPYFEKALREFDEWGCDAVLVCGDLADDGVDLQLELVAETWFKVFPNGTGKGGRPVVNLMHYGDHDIGATYATRPAVRRLLAGEDAALHSLLEGDNRRLAWERCFHERYEPITVKVVKGYPFVLYHFNPDTPRHGNDAPGLEDVLKKLKYDPSRPIFYSQHRPIARTNYTYAGDTGDTTKLFAKLPNLVAFTGHCHIPASEERSIWQGEFTSIQVPSLRYSWTRCGRENSYSELDRPARPPYKMLPELDLSRQPVANLGLFCTIHEGGLVIRRWNFANDSSLGADWTVPFSSFALPPSAKPFALENRARTLGIPEFPPNAEIRVSRGQRKDRGGNLRACFDVEFPPAKAAEGRPPANDYSVRLEVKTAELVRTMLEKRVYGRQYVTGAADDTPVVCPFALDEVPQELLFRWVVRPMNTFDGAGKPLFTPWTTCGKSPDRRW